MADAMAIDPAELLGMSLDDIAKARRKLAPPKKQAAPKARPQRQQQQQQPPQQRQQQRQQNGAPQRRGFTPREAVQSQLPTGRGNTNPRRQSRAEGGAWSRDLHNVGNQVHSAACMLKSAFRKAQLVPAATWQPACAHCALAP
jgi:hypothetical protein